MSPTASALPDDLPHWLEVRLVGLELGELVRALSAAYGTVGASDRSLEDVLGDQLDDVLRHGLSRLRPDRLAELIGDSALLLQLQERIFLEGGSYWDSVMAQQEEIREVAERSWVRLQPMLDPSSSSVAGQAVMEETQVSENESPRRAEGRPRSTTVPHRAPARARSSTLRFGQGVLVAVVTAVAVLAAVSLRDRFSATKPEADRVASGTDSASATAWGWNRPEVLDDSVSADAYLERLADAAEEWFQQHPQDALQLADRMAEFRQGCTRLILAEHRPLSAADRNWLVERCRRWAADLDALRSALEAGGDVVELRERHDEVVHRLVAALRQRAETVRTASS